MFISLQNVASVVAQSGPEKIVLRAETIPESHLLLLLGGILMVLASVVRKAYSGEHDAVVPKSMQLMLWISPTEVAEKFMVAKSGR